MYMYIYTYVYVYVYMHTNMLIHIGYGASAHTKCQKCTLCYRTLAVGYQLLATAY